MVYVRARNVLSTHTYTQIQTVNGVDLSPALFSKCFFFCEPLQRGFVKSLKHQANLVLILFISPLNKAPRLIEIEEMNFTLMLQFEWRFQLHTDVLCNFYKKNEVFFNCEEFFF